MITTEQLIQQHVAVWNSKVHAIPYAAELYERQAKGLINHILCEINEALPKQIEKYRGFPLDQEEQAVNVTLRRVSNIIKSFKIESC